MGSLARTRTERSWIGCVRVCWGCAGVAQGREGAHRISLVQWRWQVQDGRIEDALHASVPL